MMLLMLSLTSVCFELFVDGSPSSGYEAFVAVEMLVSSMFHCFAWTRLFPISFLHYGSGNLTSKVFNLLWKIFLECGPDVQLIRWRLKCTRTIISDQGTESGMADVRDCLNDFFKFIGSTLQSVPQVWLFPLCIYSVGWHHRFDHVLQDVLASLDFWPKWFESLKKILRFLRIETYRLILKVRIDEEGYIGQLISSRPPGFADWRWSTLWLCVVYIVPLVNERKRE